MIFNIVLCLHFLHFKCPCTCPLQSALKAIISRDSFCAPEVHIFQGVYEWVERNTDLTPEQIQEILSQIRLPLISLSVSCFELKLRPIYYFVCFRF